MVGPRKADPSIDRHLAYSIGISSLLIATIFAVSSLSSNASIELDSKWDSPFAGNQRLGGGKEIRQISIIGERHSGTFRCMSKKNRFVYVLFRFPCSPIVSVTLGVVSIKLSPFSAT